MPAGNGKVVVDSDDDDENEFESTELHGSRVMVLRVRAYKLN
jgi:hypothetical protein